MKIMHGILMTIATAWYILVVMHGIKTGYIFLVFSEMQDGPFFSPMVFLPAMIWLAPGLAAHWLAQFIKKRQKVM